MKTFSIDQILQKAIKADHDGKIQEAKDLYKEILKINSKHPDANHNLGLIELSVNNIETALSLFKIALEANPDIEQFWISYINNLKKEKKFEDAEEVLKKMIIHKPNHPFTYYNLGNTQDILGKHNLAEINYLKAIELKPDFFEAYNSLALLQSKLNKLNFAELNFRKSIELKPEHIEANINLSTILINNNKVEEAKLVLEKLNKFKNDIPELYYNLGRVFKESNRKDEAEKNFKKAIELKPDYAEAYNSLGTLLYDFGMLEEAGLSYRKAIELKPDFVIVHNNLGNLLKDMGKLAEAELSYKKAIKLKPDFTLSNYNFGTMLYESNYFKDAIEQFKLSDHPLSQFFLLKCFYQIDEQSSFYDQLDYLVNQDENNAIIGSLISRSNLRYGVDKKNPFCNNPINYVLNDNLNKKYDFKTIFIDGAKKILNNKKIKHKTQGLLKNGIQTSGNVFSQGGLISEEMKKIIYLEIEKYRTHFKDSGEGFIKNWPISYDIRGWLIKMKSGGNLSPHMHETGWMSGSIYINVPPKVERDSGNLVVCIDDKENDENKNKKMSIDVVTGSLCLFPSSLLHYTVPFISDDERIVLAFDVIPKHSQLSI